MAENKWVCLGLFHPEKVELWAPTIYSTLLITGFWGAPSSCFNPIGSSYKSKMTKQLMTPSKPSSKCIKHDIFIDICLKSLSPPLRFEKNRTCFPISTFFSLGKKPKKDKGGTIAQGQKLLGTACCKIPQAFTAAKPVTWPINVAAACVFNRISCLAFRRRFVVLSVKLSPKTRSRCEVGK